MSCLVNKHKGFGDIARDDCMQNLHYVPWGIASRDQANMQFSNTWWSTHPSHPCTQAQPSDFNHNRGCDRTRHQPVSVEMKTLQATMDRLGHRHVTVIKLDIEVGPRRTAPSSWDCAAVPSLILLRFRALSLK